MKCLSTYCWSAYQDWTELCVCVCVRGVLGEVMTTSKFSHILTHTPKPCKQAPTLIPMQLLPPLGYLIQMCARTHTQTHRPIYSMGPDSWPKSCKQAAYDCWQRHAKDFNSAWCSLWSCEVLLYWHEPRTPLGLSTATQLFHFNISQLEWTCSVSGLDISLEVRG